MTKILKFRQKAFSKERPSKSELESAFERIAQSRWEWEYVVDIFLRRNGGDMSEKQLREMIYKHFPMSQSNDENDNNTMAYHTKIYTQQDSASKIIERRRSSLNGEWELCLNMPSLLEDEFSVDRRKMVTFVECLPPDVEWHVCSGWSYVGRLN